MLEQQDLEHVLSHTGLLWNRLKRKRIFISGGTGFFGKWMLESFAKANIELGLNAELNVLSRNPKSFLNKYDHLSGAEGINYHQGDVRNFAFPEGEFDYIIHAATDADDQIIRKYPLSIIETIFDGTKRILEFARYSNTRKVAYVSSGAIYGKQPVKLNHVPETYSGAPDLSHPAAAYGEAKRMAELLCSIYQRQYQIETVTARCFAFVGPYLPLDLHYAIGNFIRDGLENRSIQIQGDGTTLRSYLYAADLAVWLWTILLLGKSGTSYNVGSDKEISIFDLAKKVCDEFGNKMDVVVSQNAIPGAVPDRYIPDISLAKRELGLNCRIEIEDAIQRTIHYHRNRL